MLSCVALRWRLKTENAQWPFVSSPFLAGRYGHYGAETECYCTSAFLPGEVVYYGTSDLAQRRSDQFLAFWLVMSLVQAYRVLSDMATLAR